jgi:hypothetical protein
MLLESSGQRLHRSGGTSIQPHKAYNLSLSKDIPTTKKQKGSRKNCQHFKVLG